MVEAEEDERQGGKKLSINERGTDNATPTP